MVRVFYYDEETGDTIDSLHPEICSKQKALSLFTVLSEARGSFFGLVDQNGNVLQFICLNDDKWRVDKPIPKEKGAYFCEASWNTCKKLIECIYDNVPIENYVYLEFELF